MDEEKHVPGRVKSLGINGREAIGWMMRVEHQVENTTNLSLEKVGIDGRDRA